MIATNTIDFKKLNPPMLANFISFMGWIKVKSYPDKTTLWQYGKDNDAIWLPANSDFIDYPCVIKKIIKQLAVKGDFDESEVIERLIQSYNNKDLIKLRIIADDVSRGHIQYEDGSDIFQSFKEIINSAVRTVSGVNNDVKSLFKTDSSLGQTEVGSYVVNVYCPILEVDQKNNQKSLSGIGNAGLGRQINQKLFKRLEYLNSLLMKLNENDQEDIIPDLLQQGFTKKECQAIEKLFGSKGHRDWEIKILWSKLCEHETPESIVTFSHQKSSAAHRLVKKLSALDETKTKVTLQGRILGLQRDYNDQLGSVKFATQKDGKDITVTIHLNESDYKVAHNANEIRSPVSVTGELTEARVGKRKFYQIHDINNFILYDPPESLTLDIEH